MCTLRQRVGLPSLSRLAKLIPLCIALFEGGVGADAPFSETGSGRPAVSVTTPQQLQDAVRSGQQHIVVMEHLDMTGVPRFSETTSLNTGILAIVPNRSGRHTMSIRGDCSQADPPARAADLDPPLKAGQCLITVQEDFLEAPYEGSQVWLSGLYLTLPAVAVKAKREHSTYINIIGADAYLTDMTFAGDGVNSRGLDVASNRRVFISRSHFSKFDNDEDAAIRMSAGSRATVAYTTFAANTIDGRSSNSAAAGPAMGLYSGIEGRGSAAWFHNCLFSQNRAPTTGEVAVEGRRCRVYSSTHLPTLFDRSLEKEVNPWFLEPLAVHESPAYQEDVFAYVATVGLPFLRPTDAFLQKMLNETNTPARSMPALPAGNTYRVVDPYFAPDGTLLGADGDGSSMAESARTGVIAGVCAAVTVLVVVLLVWWAVRARRRKSTVTEQESVPPLRTHEKLQKAGTPPWEAYGSPFDTPNAPVAGCYSHSDGRTLQLNSGGHMHAYGSSAVGTPTHRSSMHDTHAAHDAGSLRYGSRADAPASGAPTLASRSSAAGAAGASPLPSRMGSETVEPITDTGSVGVATREAPTAGANARERMEFVHHQLDTLAGRDVLGDLNLEPGHSNRMHGGQAVIQFAKDRYTGRLYALKFFLSHAAFAGEAALYTDSRSPLGPFLPQLRSIAGAPGHEPAIMDARARPLPPCIVMEKGESLDVWMQRNRDGVDMVTGLQVIHHVAERLADLHAAGFVHRDLKLSNIMWLPRENRWTLIDFGCAARIGEAAPLRFSLKYCPPEVLHTLQRGAASVVAAASMDSWSLGIVAVELFSSRSVLAMLEGREQVMAQILGEVPLPWEQGAEGAAELLHSLGSFRGPVLGLLRRDPAARLDVSAFVRRCRAVLERTSASNTISTTAHASRGIRPSNVQR